MGKISDALERHKRDTAIKTETLAPGRSPAPDDEVTRVPDAGGLISRNGFSPKLVVLSAPDSLDAEHFKILRTKILFPKNGESPRTIMVTSAFPGEGKTFVAANLAASVALGINEHVLLVDCDFRQPNLHEMLGYTNTIGLHEYLRGEKALADLIIRTRIEKLSLLPAGSPPPNPAELLSSSMMRNFIEEVRARYQDRFIIIDTTPTQSTAEANVLANFVDGIVFVVMAQKSPREMIQKSIENIGKNKILGIIFNGYSESYKSYRKYYKKYYKS